MKFSIQREALLAPISQVIGVVERRQTLPVLANFLLEGQGGELKISGTDMEVEMVARTPAEVDESGAVTVPARKLVDICRALPEGVTIKGELADEKLKIQAGRSRFTLSTLPAAEFPSSEQVEPLASHSIPETRFRRLLEKTGFAMAQQDVRHYLNGLLVEFREGAIRAVATDGHRLALAEVEADVGGEVRQLIVPRKGVTELIRLLDAEADEPLELVVGQSYIRIGRERLQVTTKLVDGRFPDYEAVIPFGLDRGMTVDRAGLVKSLQRVAILSNEKYRGVRMEIAGNVLKVIAHNPQQEEASEEIEVEADFDQLTVGFNVNYLMDALNALDGDSIHVALRDANSSCLLVDPAREDVRQVVMPLKL